MIASRGIAPCDLEMDGKKVPHSAPWTREGVEVKPFIKAMENPNMKIPEQDSICADDSHWFAMIYLG